MKKFLGLVAVMLAVLTGCATTKQEAKSDSKASASWADRYTSLLESGDRAKHADFSDLQAELDKIRTESKATYVYILMPIKDGEASLKGDAKGSYMLTVDGSAEPEDWGVTYDYEAQFSEAWSGQVAAARSAWNDGDIQNWSAFAPIYNSDKEVVGLLGIDYPATEVISQHPEWNRDSDQWNHMEDEITVDIPAPVKEKMEQVKELAAKYAKDLQ